MIHITGTTAVAIPACAGIRLTVNTALTGTYTLVDGAGTTQAVITNPVAGNTFTYYGLISPGTMTASGAGSATLSLLSRTVA